MKTLLYKIYPISANGKDNLTIPLIYESGLSRIIVNREGIILGIHYFKRKYIGRHFTEYVKYNTEQIQDRIDNLK